MIHILFCVSIFSCQNKAPQFSLVIDGQSKLDSLIQIAKNEGVILKASKKWVKGTLSDSTQRKVKVKLKGDMLDHIQNDFQSLQIKGEGVRFSIMNPSCRSYHQEYLIHKIFEQEDILTTSYDFVHACINNQPLFVVKEGYFDVDLLKRFDRPNGPIFRINEDRMWKKRKPSKKALNYQWEMYIPLTLTEKIKFYKGYSDTLKIQQASKLFNDFRHGTISVDSCFNLDQTAKFWAIANVFKADHALVWSNMRFYYNPQTKKMEQIGYDCFSDRLNEPDLKFRGLKPEDQDVEFHYLFMKDSMFLKRYKHYLERYRSEEFIKQIEDKYEAELSSILNQLNQEGLDIHFYKNNARLIRESMQSFEFDIVASQHVFSDNKIKSIMSLDSLYDEQILSNHDEIGYFYQSYFHREVWIKHQQDSILLPAYNYEGYPAKIYLP